MLFLARSGEKAMLPADQKIDCNFETGGQLQEKNRKVWQKNLLEIDEDGKKTVFPVT